MVHWLWHIIHILSVNKTNLKTFLLAASVVLLICSLQSLHDLFSTYIKELYITELLFYLVYQERQLVSVQLMLVSLEFAYIYFPFLEVFHCVRKSLFTFHPEVYETRQQK